MKGLEKYLLPAVAALVLLAYYVWRWTTDDDEVAPVEPAPAAASPVDAPRGPGPADDPPPPSRPSPSPSPETAAGPAHAPDAGAPAPAPARDRARSDALRQQIAQAQRTRLGRKSAEPVPNEELGTLSKDYIRERIRDDLVPLALECYHLALDTEPELAGRLTLQFWIVGEPDLGGVVDEVQIAPDSDITHPDLVECMRESMMSVEFDPPGEGGTVEVHYPFEFSTEESEP